MLASILYYGLLIPLSYLPFWVLYRISDVLFVLVYYLVPYRKKIILGNITRSFPDKPPTAHRQIMRQFYRHLCDLLVEGIKGLTISQEEILKRMKCVNADLPNHFYDAGKSVIFVGGHYNNWEWMALGIPLVHKHPTLAVYKPLRNTFVDDKTRRFRSRFGIQPVAIKKLGRTLVAHKGKPIAVVLMADQKPRPLPNLHWMDFLHQDTGFDIGTEKLARSANMAVLQGTIRKIKRGYYENTWTEIYDGESPSSEGEITSAHVRLLEASIQEAPPCWLWSHDRWRRKRPIAEANDGNPQAD